MYDNESAPTGTMLDGLSNVDALLGKRSELVKRIAPLRARYDGAGNYLGERLFKMEEAKVAVAIRARLRDAGEKTTEPQIDALVRVDEGYQVALTNEVTERQRWIELEEELKDIEWRLEMRKADAYLLGAEARLTQ